jgi:hypothetical protein
MVIGNIMLVVLWIVIAIFILGAIWTVVKSAQR